MSQSPWYYAVNGQQNGPVSDEALVALIRSGQLRAGDLVWREGMPQWLPAASVPQLQPLFGQAPMGATAAPPYGPGPISYYGQQQDGQVVYAGFWLRFVAVIIDSLVLMVCGCIVGGCIGGAIGATGGMHRGANGPELPIASQLLINLITTIIGWLYFALMESGPWQATLGKKALGLVVTDLEGRRITFLRATGRYFAKWISTIILLVGYIMAGFTEKKQALHDIIASTLVIKRS